ncbi:MAG TPA: adenine phosphoribosyltransferase [Gemmatimonadales bacterium]|nr:adenine phosphoribosyltransferase [Gemmatimonadales bacterium]
MRERHLSQTVSIADIYQRIRDVPDFPKPGILFKDITPLLLDPTTFRRAVALMEQPFRSAQVSRVVSIESRGFLLGAPIALALDAGLVPIRKPGKLPSGRGRVEYALEYGTDALEMHSDAVGAQDRVLIVDDVLATGGTAEAAGKLVRTHGADVVGFTFLIELDFLNGRVRLATERVEALLHYT